MNLNLFLKGGGSLASAALITVFGATAAHAWQWASASNVILMSGGGGYGDILYASSNTTTLQSTLKDTKLDGSRIYARAEARHPIQGTQYYIKSGLRADGESWYARMYDKTNGTYAYTTGQLNFYARLCKTGFPTDPCPDDQRGPRAGSTL